MDPEVEQAPVEGTPEQTQEQIDWQKRYEDLRPQYDRTMTEAQEARKYREAAEALQSDDDDARRRAAEFLGLEIEEPEPDLYADPNDEVRRELAELKDQWGQFTQQQQTEQQKQRDVQTVAEGLAEAQDKLGRELLPEEITLLGDAAFYNRNSQGLPDIQAVTEAWLKIREADQKSWANTKKAPHVATGGQAGTQTPNFDEMSESEQVKWMTEQVIARSD